MSQDQKLNMRPVACPGGDGKGNAGDEDNKKKGEEDE